MEFEKLCAVYLPTAILPPILPVPILPIPLVGVVVVVLVELDEDAVDVVEIGAPVGSGVKIAEVPVLELAAESVADVGPGVKVTGVSEDPEPGIGSGVKSIGAEVADPEPEIGPEVRSIVVAVADSEPGIGSGVRTCCALVIFITKMMAKS